MSCIGFNRLLIDAEEQLLIDGYYTTYITTEMKARSLLAYIGKMPLAITAQQHAIIGIIISNLKRARLILPHNNTSSIPSLS